MGSIFGGSGGGLLSAVFQVAGAVIGGPIGAAIGGAIGGIFEQALNGAMQNNGVDQNTQHQAQTAYRESYREASGGLEPNSDQGSIRDQIDKFADAAGATPEQRSDLQNQADELQSLINKLVTQANENDSATGPDGKPGKGKDNWLVAIARAMGATAGKIAGEVVKLANQMGDVKTGGDAQQQQEAAKQMQELNAQFQAQSQMLNLMTNAINTGIKTIGEAMVSVARKQ